VKEKFEDFPCAPPPRRFARTLLALSVALLAIWGFYRHYQNVTGDFESQRDIYDETRRLSPDELSRLRLAAAAFREAYGLNLRVSVRNGPVSPPPADPRTIFIGLDATHDQSVIVIPPLMAKALPPELAERLAGDFFAPYFAVQAWPEGLMAWAATALEALGEPR
jgi:hypothetical protein